MTGSGTLGLRPIQNRALEKLRASAERVGWEPTLLLE